MTPLTGRARLTVPAAVLGFWLCATGAAALEPGYAPAQDYLSALAASGADRRWLGVLMFVCGSLALVATSFVVRGLVRSSRAPSVAMAVAGGCVLVAGLVPVSCAGGAAGCRAAPTLIEEAVATGRGHSLAVVAYQVSFSVALLLLARAAHACDREGLAGLSLAGALLTPVLSVVSTLPDPGAAQRVWVLSGHVVLLALAAWPPRYGPGHD